MLLCLSEVRLPVAGRYRIPTKTEIDITLPQLGPEHREESSVPLVKTTIRVYQDKMMWKLGVCGPIVLMCLEREAVNCLARISLRSPDRRLGLSHSLPASSISPLLSVHFLVSLDREKTLRKRI